MTCGGASPCSRMAPCRWARLWAPASRCPESLLANHPSLLALVMPDDSMSRVFPAGFIVVCDPNIPPANGKIVVASVGGRTLVRRWCQGNDTILLVADSHASYDDVVVSASNPSEVVGTVVWAQSRDLPA